MENFDFEVQAGLSQSNKPKIKVVEFGGNYQQRSADGVNNNLRTFSVTYKGVWTDKYGRIVVDGQHERVLAFLDRHGGYKAFNWTSFRKPKAETIKVYCSEWSTTYDQGIVTISMQFTECL